jgi:hypothetical protein
VRMGTETELSLPDQTKERKASTDHSDRRYGSEVGAEQKEI